MHPASLSAVPPRFPFPFPFCRIGTSLCDVSGLTAVVTEPIVRFPFAFSFGWLWAFTCVAPVSPAVKTALTLSLALTATLYKVELSVGLSDKLAFDLPSFVVHRPAGFVERPYCWSVVLVSLLLGGSVRNDSATWRSGSACNSTDVHRNDATASPTIGRGSDEIAERLYYLP